MLSALFLATVIGISDGDTLTVLNADKQQVKIRLAEIIPQVKDRYKRTAARIKCDGLDVSFAMFTRTTKRAAFLLHQG
ncbi:hypothetical protein C8R32_10834 [Nitrosospira sp. Nsp5]|nr:hypothetical protein C8R32_10834 [Nitrosospira sp. Nsp5]